MGRQDDGTKLLAIALLNFADDEGYFYADPTIVRSNCRPFDEDSTNVRRSIADLSRIGYISIVEHPTQGLIGRIEKFRDHQKIDKAKGSNIKGYFDSTTIRRTFDDQSTGEGNGKEGNGKEGIVKTEAQTVAKPSRPTRKKKTDEEFLADLKTDPTYSHINIDQEFGKMANWCLVKGKQPTQARFINWINGIDKPMNIPGSSQGAVTIHQQKPGIKSFAQIREENTVKAMIDFAGAAGGEA